MKKIAIVCGSPSSEFLAPFNDESWEIWVLGNRLDRYLDKRVSRVFEIHEDLSEHQDPDKYVKWLASKNIPLVVGETFPIKRDDILPFPYKEAEKLDEDGITLASSPAYMIALAMLEGAAHIGLYGVDMSINDHEYFKQRPCLWGWVKLARGRGVKVTIPKESDLCHMTYCEGKDWNGKNKNAGRRELAVLPFTEEAFLEVAELHKNQIESLYAEIRAIEKTIQTLDGCRQTNEHFAKVARMAESGNRDIKLISTLKRD